MKKVRKMIAVLLSMVMIFGLVAGGVEAAAASGKYNNMSFPHAKRYTFRYNSGYDRDSAELSNLQQISSAFASAVIIPIYLFIPVINSSVWMLL